MMAELPSLADPWDQDILKPEATKPEIKRLARYEAVRVLSLPHMPYRGMPGSQGFCALAEALAMFLAHGSMPAAEPKPEPKTEEPA